MRLDQSNLSRRCVPARVTIVVVAAVVGLVPMASRAMEAPIAVSVAPLFVGEEKVVEGVVTAVEKDVNVLTLQLGTPPNTLAVSLIIGLLTQFPPNPEIYYAGKTVLVAGKIDRFRESLEMTIRNPANITVVDLDAAARENAKLREEQEAMRAHIKSLEERIRQLEETERDSPADSPAE